MPSLEQSWFQLSRRLGMVTDQPISGWTREIVPVIQAAVPGYSDAERPLYAGGGAEAGVPGEFSFVGFRATVDSHLQAVLPEAPVLIIVFSLPPNAPYDPTATTGETVITPDVQLGRNALSRIVRGRNAVAPAGLNTAITSTQYTPVLFETAIVPAGHSLWFGASPSGGQMRANFVWRELRV